MRFIARGGWGRQGTIFKELGCKYFYLSNNCVYLYKLLDMTVSIKKPVTKEKINKALELIEKSVVGSRPSLKDSFGSLKRGLDPMTYQNEVRNEWD
jgi:hypothetical protein